MSGKDAIDRFLERADFHELPIGVYVIDPSGSLLSCNAAGRAILELPPAGPIAVALSDFHIDVDRLGELMQAADLAEAAGTAMEKAVVQLVVEGREIFVEDYMRPLIEDATGRTVGYIGCMLDVTDDHHAALRNLVLQEKVEELTLDIGRILHANTSTLLMVNQTLAAVATALDPAAGTDDEYGLDRADDMDPTIQQTAAGLAAALGRLVASSPLERRLEALPQDGWDMLETQVRLLEGYSDLIPVREMRNPALRTSAAAVAQALRQIKPHVIARQPVRDGLRLAQQLQREICFADVINTRTTVVQMDFTLRALRDFVTAEVRPHESQARLLVVPLVQEAISQLAEFARASGVDIVWRERPPDLAVLGSERDILRAVSNLLHNAIKYSWRRDRSNAPWVSIRTEERDGFAALEFESWGVPITEEEIDTGVIYQMGYRGKWSTDRGRLGTGIGLTDAQRVAVTHGGDLRLESKPAHPTGQKPSDAGYYNHPFLTRVTLNLPRVD